MLKTLRSKFRNLKVKIFDVLCIILGLPNVYASVMRQAAATIARLEGDIRRLDTKNSLDVRSQLSHINLDQLGEIVWISVSDERMLRYDVFNQIRDYLASHGKGNSILIVTGPNEKVTDLTDEDLRFVGLQRIKSGELTQ